MTARAQALEQRQRIVRRATQALTEVDSLGDSMRQRTAASVERLAAEVKAERAAGRMVSKATIRRLPAYRDLVSQLEIDAQGFMVSVRGVTNREQFQAVASGVSDAQALVIDADSEATVSSVPMSAQARLLGTTTRGRSRAVTTRMRNEAQKDTRDAIVDALVQKMAPSSVQSAARDSVDAMIRRGQTIVLEETMRSYRGATGLVYKRSSLREWIWLSVQGVRTCVICYSQHGKRFPMSVSLSSHVGCRCTMLPVSPSDPGLKTGEELFADLPESKQRQILGPRRHELYAGGMTLDEMVTTRTHPVWGEQRVIIPLARLG